MDHLKESSKYNKNKKKYLVIIMNGDKKNKNKIEKKQLLIA